MNFSHFASGVFSDHFAEAASGIRSLSLIAHLGCDLSLADEFGELPRFPNGMGEWFLAVNMFATLHSSHGREGVDVVGSGDNYRVDVFLLIEHDAEVFVLP